MASRRQYQVTLPGPAPWGFRLSGGKEFSLPLFIFRVTPGGRAAMANIAPGDVIVRIGHCEAENLTHIEAQKIIKTHIRQLELTLIREDMYSRPLPAIPAGPSAPTIQAQPASAPGGGPAPGAASVLAPAPAPAPAPIRAPHPAAAPVPTVAEPSVDVGAIMRAAEAGLGKPATPIEIEAGGRKIVHAQYDTPLAMYSTGAVQDTLEGHLVGVVDGKPEVTAPQREPGTIDTSSAVYQMIQEESARRARMPPRVVPPPEPEPPIKPGTPGHAQSRSFRVLQMMTGEDGDQFMKLRQVKSKPKWPLVLTNHSKDFSFFYTDTEFTKQIQQRFRNGTKSSN
ncbi:PDZ and LIM domain protein 3-like isoform X2 [Branchiostoma lanceolatum]|uniref:PDZ and LIM domain protein 3-like isoform X2 n=1 Tax=Branchiostoma lanceolatum TaxID=7740 RepID=UPI0034553258